MSEPDRPRHTRRRLGPDDWARAALEALATGGPAAVAVEPIAARLGTTKGSFYWHFPNRGALLAAALDLWESRRTEAVIALMDAEPDPLQRLRRLFAGTVDAAARDRVEVALLSAAEDPVVGTVLRRVTERRIDYVARAFAELGLAPDEARDRALLAFSVYLGTAQLAHVAPDSLPESADRRRAYLDRSIALLVTQGVPGATSGDRGRPVPTEGPAAPPPGTWGAAPPE